MFIFAIEGIDNIGKTTAIQRLQATHNFNRNIKIYDSSDRTAFPELGCHLKGTIQIPPRQIADGFIQRINNILTQITKDKPDIALIDRYFFSTRAYYQVSTGKPLNINIPEIKNLYPIFVLVKPAHVSHFVKNNPDIYEKLEFQLQVAQLFQNFSKNNHKIYIKSLLEREMLADKLADKIRAIINSKHEPH